MLPYDTRNPQDLGMDFVPVLARLLSGRSPANEAPRLTTPEPNPDQMTPWGTPLPGPVSAAYGGEGRTGPREPKPQPEPTDAEIARLNPDLASKWWNQGKPPNEWTPYPPVITPPPTPTPTPTTGTGDPVRDFVLANKALLAKHDRMGQDPEYWIRRIKEEGSFAGKYNQAYWLNRMQHPGVAGVYDQPPPTPTTTTTRPPWTGIPGFNIDPNQNNPLFDDPASQMFEDAIRKRLAELIQPVNDPARQQLADLLQGRTTALQSTPVNPELATLLGQAKSRIAELQQAPYTAPEEAALRAKAFDQLEQDRQSAIRTEVQRMLSLGHAPTSGTIQEATDRINRQYDQLHAQQQNALTVAAIDRRQQRLDQALQTQQGLYGITAGEQERTEARRREGIDTGSILAELTQATRTEENTRRREALSLAALLPDVERQRMLDAMAILEGTTPNSQGLFAQILGLQGFQAGQENIRRQQQADFFGGLGSWLGILMGSGQTGGTTTPPYMSAGAG